MCRWFAYISPVESCLLEDVLLSPANSISKQVSEHYLPKLLPHGEEKELEESSDRLLRLRNVLINMDGLGVAWYSSAATDYVKDVTGLRPALYKSQSPPSNDFNFRSLCRNTETTCVLAHIRATSGSVVSPVNCHPFVFGRHMFMHNGVISKFLDIKREMSDLLCYDAYCNILGSTDSEHAAALYMTYLTDGQNKDSWEKKYSLEAMQTALTRTVLEIMKLQFEKWGDKSVPNSLNFCVTDGRKMVAIRFRNHATEEPPSLYWSEVAGRTLNSKYEGHPDGAHLVNKKAKFSSDDMMGKHTIIASEPTTYDAAEWQLIGKNCVLTVDDEGVQKETLFEYDEKFNAEVDSGVASG